MTRSRSLTRRQLLGHSAKATAAAFAAPWYVPAPVLAGPGRVGANDRIQIGVIGCGVRGKYLIGNMPAGGQVVALCDSSRQRMQETREPRGEFQAVLADFRDTDAAGCRVDQDYRRMLEQARLDAVIIAAPDHHHAQAAMLACRAGLDVYVEKPLSLTIAEGRAMCDAAQRYDRVVQVGSQQRSMAANRVACEFVRDGGLGRVSLVEVPNYPGPLPTPDLPAEPIPEGLDWDLFCGPTEPRAYHRDLWVKDEYKHGYLTWRGWDNFRSFSGHLMTNWGGHSVDMVQYALGMDESGPVEIWPEPLPDNETDFKQLDDRWHDKTPPLGTLRDKRQDAMRFCAVSMRYANGTLLKFDPGVKEVIVHGERGRLHISRNNYRAAPADLLPPPDAEERQRWTGSGHVARPHIQNWLNCIRERRTTRAPIETGHRTATVCHLANIARELGRRLHWDPAVEQFVDDPAANALLSRSRRQGFELPV